MVNRAFTSKSTNAGAFNIEDKIRLRKVVNELLIVRKYLKTTVHCAKGFVSGKNKKGLLNLKHGKGCAAKKLALY